MIYSSLPEAFKPASPSFCSGTNQCSVLGPINFLGCRDVDLAELLDLSVDDMTSDPTTPKNLQKHYSGVYFVNAPHDQPKTEFVPQPSRFATQQKV